MTREDLFLITSLDRSKGIFVIVLDERGGRKRKEGVKGGGINKARGVRSITGGGLLIQVNRLAILPQLRLSAGKKAMSNAEEKKRIRDDYHSSIVRGNLGKQLERRVRGTREGGGGDHRRKKSSSREILPH